MKLIVASLAAALSLNAMAAPEKFSFDATHTYPTFEVSHLGFSITRGMFKETAGTLELDREAKTGKFEATIQAASIETGLVKRDEHLRTKDFFNVAEHPTIVVKSDKFSFDADKPSKAEGTLTLLGVTKPVSLVISQMKCATNPWQKYVCGGEVSTTIKRSEWGMKYGSPNIGEEVKITVQVEAVKQ